MKAEIDVKIKMEDMYRFNLYHAYHTSQGILSVIFAAFLFGAAIYTGISGRVNVGYCILYGAMGIFVLLYVPFTLKQKSKRQIKQSEVFANTLHYTFDEEGITTAQGQQSANLPWSQVYKIVETSQALLIYGARTRAFVIPVRELTTEGAVICKLAAAHMDTYRLKLKRKGDRQP